MKNRAVPVASSLVYHGDLRGHPASKARLGRLATTVLITLGVIVKDQLKKKRAIYWGSQFERVQFITVEG